MDVVFTDPHGCSSQYGCTSQDGCSSQMTTEWVIPVLIPSASGDDVGEREAAGGQWWGVPRPDQPAGEAAEAPGVWGGADRQQAAGRRRHRRAYTLHYTASDCQVAISCHNTYNALRLCPSWSLDSSNSHLRTRINCCTLTLVWWDFLVVIFSSRRMQ